MILLNYIFSFKADSKKSYYFIDTSYLSHSKTFKSDRLYDKVIIDAKQMTTKKL